MERSKDNGEGMPKQGRLEFGLTRNPLDSARPHFVLIANACLTFEEAVDALDRMTKMLEKIAPARGPKRRAR